MHRKYLDYLADPETLQPLQLIDDVWEGDELISGKLVCNDRQYPVVNGIPRFVNTEKDYTKSFSYQWNKWRKVQFESENKGRKMEGYTKKMWEIICGVKPEERLDGKLILDIGCGPGRFIDVARSKGAIVIGIDYSNAADVAAENFKGDHDVCILQADALKLPLKESVLDGAYTIGVLHHTPSPAKGVEQAYKKLKKGGWFGISVYAKGGYYDKASVTAWRKLFNFMWPVFKHYPPLIYSNVVVTVFRPFGKVPFLGKFVRLFFPYVNLPDKKWSVLDTFDSLTPSYQSAHESYEVFKWLKENGMENVEPTDWSFTAYRGIK